MLENRNSGYQVSDNKWKAKALCLYRKNRHVSSLCIWLDIDLNVVCLYRNVIAIERDGYRAEKRVEKQEKYEYYET